MKRDTILWTESVGHEGVMELDLYNVVNRQQSVMELDPYSVVNVIFILLLLSFLAGCTSLFSSAPPTVHRQASIPTRSSVGCGHASPIAVGASTSITVPINPATSEGQVTLH